MAHQPESFEGQQGVELLPDGKHPVDEVLKPAPMLVFGLQHVMSMYAGVVAVPFIVGSALKLSFADLSYLLAATLLVSGLATLLQTLGVKWIGAKLPIVQGTSFAAVASMIAVGASAGGGVDGLRAIFGSVLIAGLAGFLLSGVFARLLRFFPPVVTGSVITVIGLSLLPVAMNWAGGGAGAADFGSISNVALAAITEIGQSLPILDRDGDIVDAASDLAGVLAACALVYGCLALWGRMAGAALPRTAPDA